MLFIKCVLPGVISYFITLHCDMFFFTANFILTANGIDLIG